MTYVQLFKIEKVAPVLKLQNFKLEYPILLFSTADTYDKLHVHWNDF